MNILLVEDNPGDARLLRELLRESPLGEVSVRHTVRLQEAVDAAAGSTFDFVLLDLSLPDSTGIETLSRMLGAVPETPIVVLTGLDDESVALRAVQAGAQDYLVKGAIDPGLLVRSIRYAIERKRLEIERIRALESEKEARSAAEAAVRARDEVMGIVSHDLGNSLSAIRLQCRVLERSDAGGNPAVARGTATIRLLIEQMHRLRQDLIDVVSLEAGRLSLHVEPAPLEPIIDEVIETLGMLAGGKDLNIRTELPTHLPMVAVDRQRILQVFSNLLGNAVKFTPPGGTITFRVAGEAAEVLISVEDTGPGITPEDARRVFDPFWRKERGERGGAGLGLAIARGIVERHGGRIWVESEAGHGSAFRFTLPPVPN